MRNRFEAEGEIRGTDLLASLVALWREGASGSLQFSRSGSTAGFDLSAGEIVAVSSSDPRFETAAILLRAGKLDATTLDRLSAPGGDRAAVALQAGVLTKREWRWGEKIRAVEVLSDLLGWLEGEYTFYRAPIRDAGEFRLTVPRLVLELFLRSRDRGLVLHYLGGVDVPLARTRTFDAEFETFGLTADAESVVSLIDGKSTAAEIASEAPAEPFAVEKLLAALVTLGLVHPEFVSIDAESAAPPRPSPAARNDEEPEEEEDEAEPEARDEPESDEPTDSDAPLPEADRPDEGESPEDLNRTVRMEMAPLVSARREEPDAADETDLSQPEEPDEAYDPDRLDTRASEVEPDEAYRSLDVPTEEDADGFAVEEPESPLADLAMSPSGSDRDDPGDPEGLGGPGPARALPEDFEGEFRETAPEGFDRPLDTTTGVGAAERPRPRSRAVMPWVLVLLAAAVAAILLWRSREPSGPSDASAVAEPEPSPTSGRVSPAPAAAPPVVPAERAAPPSPAPARSTPTAVATRPPAATRTAAPAAPTRAAVRTPAAAPAPAVRIPASRQQWMDRAARDRRRTEADRRARFTVQLELACELESLADAWKHDRGGAMWLVTQPYQGRTCFRVLWGRYPSREAALRGLDSAPRFFSTPNNRPIVVPIR